MNILWYSWLDIVREIAITQGLDYDLGQVEPPIARKFSQSVNAATEIAWKFAAWPCACWVWNSSVYRPIFEPGYDVLASYSGDPLAAWSAGRDPKRLQLRETQGDYLVQGTWPESTYFLIRTPAPRFGINEWDAARAYKAGDLIYDVNTGEAWRCVRAHTNRPVVIWQDWTLEHNQYTQLDPFRHRRNGVLWDCVVDHDPVPELEPGYGPDWYTYWDPQPHYWAPQRLPAFMLQAVLHGARAWLAETPPLPRSALEAQMEGWLASEWDDLRYNRNQAFATGGGLTIL